MSEALILASTNPQYDDRLFNELQVQHMKNPSWGHAVYINCSECQNKNNLCTQHVLYMFSTCSELGIFMYYQTCDSMNNLSSYCGLVDAEIRASDKDLPVKKFLYFL